MSEHLSTLSSLLQEVRRSFGFRSVDCGRRLAGYSSTNHLILADDEHYVLKIRPPGNRVGLEREIHYGTALLKVGVPWPSPLHAKDGLQYLELDRVIVQLIPFVEGRTLHRPNLTEKALRSAAQIARAIHSVEATEDEVEEIYPLEEVFLEARRSNVDKSVQQTCLKLLDFKRGLLNELSGRSFKKAVIHGDFHGENLLFDEEARVCAVLDLEQTGTGSIGYDLFSFISLPCCLTEFSRENCYVAAPFLREYYAGEDELHGKVSEAFHAYLFKWAKSSFLEREAIRGNEMVVPLIERDVKKFEFLDEGAEKVVRLFLEGMGE